MQGPRDTFGPAPLVRVPCTSMSSESNRCLFAQVEVAGIRDRIPYPRLPAAANAQIVAIRRQAESFRSCMEADHTRQLVREFHAWQKIVSFLGICSVARGCCGRQVANSSASPSVMLADSSERGQVSLLQCGWPSRIPSAGSSYHHRAVARLSSQHRSFREQREGQLRASPIHTHRSVPGMSPSRDFCLARQPPP